MEFKIGDRVRGRICDISLGPGQIVNIKDDLYQFLPDNNEYPYPLYHQEINKDESCGTKQLTDM